MASVLRSQRLATDGASVAVTYSKGADAAAAVVKAIEHAGGRAIAIQAEAAERLKRKTKHERESD